MPLSPSSSTSTTFFKDELGRALQEQTFGIASFAMGNATAFEARARVHLLENVEVDITLSLRGYQATNVSSSEGSGSAESPPVLESGPIHETLEALLQQRSPLYAARRTAVLIDKLSG